MSCDACELLEDITDLKWPYTVKTCTSCGRKIKQRRSGEHGIGVVVDHGDSFVMPREFLVLSANPLKGTGEFSQAGLLWFAKLIFDVELAKKERVLDMPEVLQALLDANEKTLRDSTQFTHVDFEAADATERLWTIASQQPESVEWWALLSTAFYAAARDAIERGDAVEAAWAMASGERLRALMLFRQHFEEVVFMGHSAKRLINLLDLWSANRRNASEGFWQQTLSTHGYAIGQMFAAPVTVIQEKAYVGGTTLDRTDGRLLDFMLSGSVSSDAILLEIKTPMTALLGAQYRANAYAPSAELSGAIVQVSDYCQEFRDNIQSLTKGLERPLTAFNPKCVVLIGDSERELDDPTKRRSFELFRGSLSGVEIVTFDEFFKKVESLAKLFNLVRTSATT